MFKIEALNNINFFNIIKVVDFKEYNEFRIYYFNNTDEIISFTNQTEFNDFKNMLNNILNKPKNVSLESIIN